MIASPVFYLAARVSEDPPWDRALLLGCRPGEPRHQPGHFKLSNKVELRSILEDILFENPLSVEALNILAVSVVRPHITGYS